jgi:HEAT repeat protein
VLTALAYSNAPGIPTLFQHMVKSDKIIICQLGALGCGLIRDTQYVDELDILLDEQPSISRAACLALVNIGTKPALNIIADALVEGNEDLRRSAAEAFAGNTDDGHAALKEGSTMDDLLLRRSVIYGLRKIDEPWSIEILEQMQIEDGQWVVRNAAAQVVEELQNFDPHIPIPLDPLEETTWLIAYASQHGMGVSPGEQTRSMLIRAFMEGSKDQRLAAMDQIRLRGDPGIFPEIYHLLYGDNYELREAAYNTLWHIGLTGSEIPPPNQFGLG